MQSSSVKIIKEIDENDFLKLNYVLLQNNFIQKTSILMKKQ